MFDLKNFSSAIEQIAEERNITKESIVEAIEAAVATAYRKEYGSKGEHIRAKLDLETGTFQFWQVKTVLDESMVKTEEEIAQEAAEDYIPHELQEGEVKKYVFNPEHHIMLDEAQIDDPKIQVGDEVTYPLEPHADFGRIAAQAAKQVVLQKIREAEKTTVYQEYKQKEGTLVSGLIQRIEGRNVYVDLGKTVGIMYANEGIYDERYRIGERRRFYILAVQEDMKGPAVILSRAHPQFVAKLFEIEVPEINDNIVEIKAIAREPGSRTKIAVVTHVEAIDPIGSCVGQKGTRVMAVMNELGGEKIDIIAWSEDPATFITNALSPAKVQDIEIHPYREALVYVAPEQISLAIGRSGQNVRLAARLTNWKIDVRSSEKPEESVEGGVAAISEEGEQETVVTSGDSEHKNEIE
ncbi:MAG: transcription termination/antitermination protein NusA [Patescibacteria group bacterium]|nr:transcription termination/antitermination protein NusA [Patescibacteria group bacterium]MDE2438496.1 transcription termination/antitermination protein NusA [Patescibacteria group bacterium]